MLDQSKIESLAQEFGTPLLVLDCAQLKRQVEKLQAALPEVGLFYAVKACSEPEVLANLAKLDVGFDVASATEFSTLRELDVAASRVIHTHPIKTDAEIKAALRMGCTTFVVDNAAEIKKFSEYRSRVGLLLRVAVENQGAVVNLSAKFGCQPSDAQNLIEYSDSLGVHIKGLSFHIGSQSDDAKPFVAALAFCQKLFQWSKARGKPLRILDIGGGFPVGYGQNDENIAVDIEAYCQPIREGLAGFPTGVEVIAEPGRYIAAPSVTAIASVIGRAQRGGKPWYYLDDGVYGSYSGQIYDHAKYPVRSLKSGKTVDSALAGPTCDSIDMVAEAIELPELDIGDLIVGEQMGAYTAASASDFNGLKRAKLVAINRPEKADGLVAFRRRS